MNPLPLELRPYQRYAAEKIREALAAGKNVLLSQPTGTGKTRTVVAALYDAEFSVFTKTHNEYSAWEREARAAGRTFGGLVGKERVCQHPVQEVTILGNQKKTVFSRCVVMMKGEVVAHCEYNPQPTPETMRRLQSMGVRRFTQGEPGKWCGYYFAREAEADIKLFTYPAYFFRKNLLRPDVKVFDEFHNLMEVNSLLEFSFRKQEIEEMIAAVKHIQSRGGPEHSAHRAAAQREEGFLTRLLEWLDADDADAEPPEPNEYNSTLVAEFFGLVYPKEAMPKVMALYQDKTETIAAYLRNIRAHPKTWKKYPDADEPGRYRIRPLDPAILLGDLNKEKWIGLSGTPPSRAYLEEVLRLKDVEIIKPETPFPAPRQYGYHFSKGVVLDYESREGNRAAVVQTVAAIAASNQGKTLVVTPNYSMAAWFTRLPSAFVETPKSTLADLKPGYKTIVANAHGKFTEGIELTSGQGSEITRIVLAGVPFPNVGDPFYSDMLEYVSGGDPRRKWLILREYARIKTFQAIGRAVRGPSDHVEVYLIDDRFKRMGWTYPGGYRPTAKPTPPRKPPLLNLTKTRDGQWRLPSSRRS